ncbi:MAG: GIY-YIG nuclease family protein [Prevotellaceae bacterium]|nr:GIY-YIG nuclease family protein [Prevotellaceae bacterium]
MKLRADERRSSKKNDSKKKKYNNMKVYKFLPPYQKDGKATFRESLNRTGVYIIKENEKIVYIGYSGYNLYKTMYRHFQSWNHKFQDVVSYKSTLNRKKYTVRIVYCTKKQAYVLEKKLIQKYKPRDNELKYKDIFSENRKVEKYAEKVYEEYADLPVNFGLPY